MSRIKRCSGVFALMALAAASLSAGPALASSQQGVRTKAAWQAAIALVREPGTGCYHASYPVLRWQAARCVTAPKFPLVPAPASAGRATPATVGNGDDYVSLVTPGTITRATGTFQDVSKGIAEKGKVDNKGSKVANAFTLQLNTDTFYGGQGGTPACSGSSDPSSCQGWQQFVYLYSGGTGYIFMQYWLLDYDATCPKGWYSFESDCYTDSSASTLTPLTATELATVKLTASAKSGGNDGVSLSVGSGKAVSVTNSDSMLDLAPYWDSTEWDVFGDAGGAEAYFGSDTTLVAVTALTVTQSSTASCAAGGYTGETNNLKLTKTPALGSEPSPTMASEQTNGKTATPSCATAG